MDSLVDIKMDENWKLTQAANGDAPTVSGVECILQDIKLEAVTQEKEIFYDENYGWSLLDFIQAEDNALTRTEIEQRIKSKLSNRDYIDSDSIEILIVFTDITLTISIAFKFINDDETYTVDLVLNRIKVEVVNED